MAAKVLDRPISLLSRLNITSLRFELVRFYPQPRQTERHRTYTLCIRRSLEVIPGLLSPGRLTAGVIGPRRLRLVITQRARGFLIQPSMFRPMAGPLRVSFMTIGIIPALMCWLIFTWHNPLISVIPGSPTSGLLRSQPMPPSLRSPPMVTCSVIILALPKLPDQRCRRDRYGVIHEPGTPVRSLPAPGLRPIPTWLQLGKPRENHSCKCRPPLYMPRVPMLITTA